MDVLHAIPNCDPGLRMAVLYYYDDIGNDSLAIEVRRVAGWVDLGGGQDIDWVPVVYDASDFTVGGGGDLGAYPIPAYDLDGCSYRLFHGDDVPAGRAYPPALDDLLPRLAAKHAAMHAAKS